MKVNVRINAKQILEDHEEVEQNNCEGEINYYNNGTILEFTEKHEELELKFKMTILKDKIITERNGQNMTFDLENKCNTKLNTPYGMLGMDITTKKIDVIKENDKIKEIHLGYDIELDNKMQYYNMVDILVEEK